MVRKLGVNCVIRNWVYLESRILETRFVILLFCTQTVDLPPSGVAIKRVLL